MDRRDACLRERYPMYHKREGHRERETERERVAIYSPRTRQGDGSDTLCMCSLRVQSRQLVVIVHFRL